MRAFQMKNKNQVHDHRKRNKKTDDKNVNKYQCQYCWEIVDSFTALTIHLRQHSFRENGIPQCLLCLQSFCSDKLNLHMLIHSSERPYKCKHCNRTFITRGDLNCHKRFRICIAPKYALHSCWECYMNFKTLCDLDIHERSHGSSPVRCNHCNTITCNPAAYVKHKCKTVQVKSSEKCKNGKLQHGFDNLYFVEFSSHKCPFVAKVQSEQRVKHPNSAFEIFDCKVCSILPRQQALNSRQKCPKSKITLDTFERYIQSLDSLQIHKLNLRSVESCPSPTLQRDEVMQASQNDVRNGKEHFLPQLNLKTSESVTTEGNSEAFISRTSKASLFSAAVIFTFYFGKMKMSQLSQLAFIVHQRYHESKMTTNCATPDFESPGRLQTRKLNLRSVESCPSPTFQRNEIINLPKSPSIANYANATIPDISSREDTPSASVTHDVPTVSEDREMHGRKIRNLKFKKESALIQHSRIHKSHVQRRSTHSCNTCSYAGVHQSPFKRHLKNPNGDVIICLYAFTTKFNCERHVKHVHKIVSKADIQNAMRRNMPYKSGAGPFTASLSETLHLQDEPLDPSLKELNLANARRKLF